MSADQSWRLRAMCDGLEPAEIERIYFPHHNADATEAKRICFDCPVVAECLADAPEFGVWGGLTERERAALRVSPNVGSRRSKPPTVTDRCGTYAGVQVHRRRKEQFCTACKAARNEYELPRKQARREAKRAEGAA